MITVPSAMRVMSMDNILHFNDPMRIAILDAMASLESVSTAEEFLSFTRNELQKILPHHTSACGVGKLKNDGLIPHLTVMHDYPNGYFKEISRTDGSISTPVIACWIATKTPQLFELTPNEKNMSPEWTQLFKEYDLQNIAAHGVIESQSKVVSHFNFFRVEAHLTEQHKAILSLLVPHMHLAMLRIAERQLKEDTKTAVLSTSLTDRQKETLELMYRGKTNWEISKVLGISERTAKFHVEEVIRRLRAANRTEAVSKAREQNL